MSDVSYNCTGFSNSAVSLSEKFDLTVSLSPLKEEDSSLQVALTFSSTGPTSDVAVEYNLSITVHGEFVLDKSKLPWEPDQFRKWGEKNGVLVLLPFLRETVHTFTMKTGFKPVMIPLVETSAFKVMPPKSPQAPTRATSAAVGS